MSELNMLPVPVIQMGLVEKLVEVEQNQPHVQQLVAQESARQALKAESERVPVVDVTEQGKKIRDRDPEREKKERSQARTRLFADRADAEDHEDEAAAEAGSSKGDPWSGQIVNMKV